MDRRKRDSRGKPGRGGPARDAIALGRIEGGPGYELDYPTCVRRRAEDMEEVRAMLEAGEYAVAKDELLWLLEDCRSLLEAHALLGEIALAEKDVELARGHFGYAYQLGAAALGKQTVSLPSTRPANRPFFQAGKGLAWCLWQQGETQLATEIVERLVALDPLDPLGVRNVLSSTGEECP